MGQFDGKCVLVTGSSRGIGYAVALAYAKEGAKVAITATSIEKARDVAARIVEMTGAETLPLELHVSDSASCDAAVAETTKSFGRLDILVNNAGITKDGLIIRMKEDDFCQVIDVNLKGTFLMCKAVAKIMMKQRCGRIVNISSVVGQAGQAGQANYAASKAGIIGLTKSLARELASRNILVNAVAPGFVKTDMTDKLSDETKAEIVKNIPLQKPCMPEDIANSVLFLTGAGSSYITGQVIAVNGGMYM